MGNDRQLPVAACCSCCPLSSSREFTVESHYISYRGRDCHNCAGVEVSARVLAMCRFFGARCNAVHCLHPTFCCNKLQHTSPFLFPHCCSSYFSFIRILRRAAGAVAVRQHRYHWCSELFNDRRSHHSTHARYFVPQPTAWVLPFAKNTSLR